MNANGVLQLSPGLLARATQGNSVTRRNNPAWVVHLESGYTICKTASVLTLGAVLPIAIFPCFEVALRNVNGPGAKLRPQGSAVQLRNQGGVACRMCSLV